MSLPPIGATVRVHNDSATGYRRMVGTVVKHLPSARYPVLVDFGRDAMLRDLPTREQFAADEIEVAS